eukprot:TRINITY_DN6614_c0_g1_i4.p1 TRINITY_DN6614_c0_g1~~TRINITY_DN6614_c0_g1_i4.p1  ORF type:complete len:802 (-),score=147.88 TRINITY_DN6614_c0_g1_i4:87-2492(-)
MDRFQQRQKNAISAFANANLITEQQLGKMTAIKIGSEYERKKEQYSEIIDKYDKKIEKTVDLFCRIKNTAQAEEVTTVFYCIQQLKTTRNIVSEDDLYKYILSWKPHWDTEEKKFAIASAIRNLAVLRWISVEFSSSLPIQEEVYQVFYHWGNMVSFTEAKLEQAIIELLGKEGYPHVLGGDIARSSNEVLIKDDLKNYLAGRYAVEHITDHEIDSVIRQLEVFSASDFYESNKAIMKMVSDGYLLKREDRSKKDLYIQLIDYSGQNNNLYKIVNQLEICGYEKRIPDGILYINGLPLVVFEFKSAIREEATIHDAYVQLTTRYRRDIPELFKYNAFCVISDGINNKAGSFFAPYEFFYAWRKINSTDRVEKDGIDSLYTMAKGMFNHRRLRDIIRNFIYFPDSSQKEEKIVCRYPQYYAATKLYENIKVHRRPDGDGKGGTYFGATGCGKSYTMLFLARLLMKSVDFSSPTIVLITDRTDLDDQLSGQFTNAKGFIGDEVVVSVESRQHLRDLLKGRNSGGVFLTTIHKFTEDARLLTNRNNVICISDEAHRSQVNLDQKVRVTENGVMRSFGFAKYLHDSLPNATYVGFTGTPIDATLEVFGEVVDAYTMTESVRDEITVRIVYEGRAAKVLLDNSKLDEIESYYAQCAEDGTSEYQIEESKKANAQMNSILGDPDRIKALAEDFVRHYEIRIEEGATVKGKAMFVSSSRQIAYALYKEIVALRPEWAESRVCEEGAMLTDKERKEIKPMERVKMIMTRDKDDPQALYEILGNKDNRKELDRQFKEYGLITRLPRNNPS